MKINAPSDDPVVPMGFGFKILLGFALLIFCFGGIGAWAVMSELDSAVVAGGQVRVHSHVKAVQHAEGGLVKSVYVRDGDKVNADQTLMVLSETKPRANFEIAKSNLDALKVTEVRLTAERDGEDKLDFSDAYFEDADGDVQELISGQVNLFEARRVAQHGEQEILEKRVVQQEKVIDGLRAQEKSKVRQIELISQELDALNKLFKQGNASQTRILELDRRKSSLIGERGELIAEVARAEQTIGETRLQILQLNKRFREEVVNELRDVKTKILDYTERLTAAEYTLKHIVIRAPVAGTVVGLTVHNKDAVISPGQVVAEIVPQDDDLVIEARISPIEIDNLIIGQDADVRITAFDSRTTPILHGRFDYVSADSITDPNSRETYYQAHIRVSDEQLKRLDGKSLVPGMPAEVMIKTGSRSPLDYLLEPVMVRLNKAMREG